MTLLQKYKTYLSNVQWHIDTNKPEGEELRDCLGKKSCYEEIVRDLEASEDDRNNFAISFHIWAAFDPQAKAYNEAGITAYGLLEKYKDRPFINPDTSKQ